MQWINIDIFLPGDTGSKLIRCELRDKIYYFIAAYWPRDGEWHLEYFDFEDKLEININTTITHWMRFTEP